MVSVSISVSQVVTSATASDEAMEVAKKSLFAMSDTEILEGIYATHVVSHEHDSFDVRSLFSITQSIIKCSKQIIDNIDHKTTNVTEPIGVFDYLIQIMLNLKPMATQVYADTRDGITIAPSFSTPLCLLKSIIREVPCKAPGEENAHDATLKILNKVSKYSWEAKAVLALAAFSLEYGEFWLTARHQQSDQLAKSVAFLKGVPVLLKPENLKQRGQAVAQLNNVIMSTLQVIDCIFELEKLSITYNELAPLISPSLLVMKKLQTYMKLKQLFQIPTEIMEVMKTLIFFKDNVNTTILDGSTKKPVHIDVLRTTNVLLFISSLDISEDYISLLKTIYDFTKKSNEYKIVWVPVVEKWTTELQVKFETLRVKMPWYTVGQAGAHIAGIKYIKEDWNFHGKPMLVVLNSKSELQHSNALRMISIWGKEAFPFDQKKEEELLLSLRDTWFTAVIDGIHTSVTEWIKQEKYIFFYGGDSVWTNQFKEKASALKNDDILKRSKISLELYHVEKNANNDAGDDSFNTFWSAIETMFHIKVSSKQIDDVVRQVQKLLSYKDDKSGWAVLIQGRRIVTIGAGSTIYTVLEKYYTWNQQVTITIENFGQVFEQQHKEEVVKIGHVCSCFSIPSAARSTLAAMICYECGNLMEISVRYKCCHVKK
ncbi:protein SIEVE ELEMENT OCCLUSION B-like [Prunus avium]|uniref:Protein SIEVE ELEMENT OCCLUSION B-like n=1 Tax=Prunus avium TaxID=42229 RepID=A0A6P5T4I2_PRUAV|nr:protein SIEVE ELEMENT OCCLUSION B-like [Prunus avium]